MAAAPEHLWHTLPHHYVNTHDAGCATSPFYFYLPSTGQVGVKKKKNLSCNPSLQEAEGNNCLKAGAVCSKEAEPEQALCKHPFVPRVRGFPIEVTAGSLLYSSLLL